MKNKKIFTSAFKQDATTKQANTIFDKLFLTFNKVKDIKNVFTKRKLIYKKSIPEKCTKCKSYKACRRKSIGRYSPLCKAIITGNESYHGQLLSYGLKKVKNYVR